MNMTKPVIPGLISYTDFFFVNAGLMVIQNNFSVSYFMVNFV